MRWLSGRSVATKTYTAVVVAVLAALAVGTLGIAQLSATADRAKYLYSEDLVPVSELGHLQGPWTVPGRRLSTWP